MKKVLAFLLSLLILCSVCVAFGEYTDAETILAVQTALHDAGIYKGNLSGIKGNATESAIRTYQQKNGLKNEQKSGVCLQKRRRTPLFMRYREMRHKYLSQLSQM